VTAVRSLLTLDGKLSRPSPEEVRALGGRKPEAPYWLDIQDPAEEDYRLLLDDYRFHPLSVEDVRTRNQRPKLDAFPGYLFMVLFRRRRSTSSASASPPTRP